MFQVHSLSCDSVGKFSVEQQVRDFEISALLRKLIDRITAIFKNSLVAVDERDATLARGGVHERRVVGHQDQSRRQRL